VEKFEERQGVSNFVPLQSPDEMPPRGGGQQRNFRARFLDPAFAEQLLARIKREAHLLGLVRFGNGHEFDLFERAAGLLRSFRDLCPDALEISRDVFHKEL